MGLRRIRICVTTLGLAVLCALPTAAHASFQLGLQDNGFGAPPGSGPESAAYAALQQVDGSVVRIDLPWGLIAPQGNSKPQGFDASNPADPDYSNWRSTTDVAVKDAVAHHATVILQVTGAPKWAQGNNPPAVIKTYGGAWDVNGAELGAFMYAAAERYSGHFTDPAAPGTYLPQVSHWEIWNEENLPNSLTGPNRVADYRAMLNASYSAIKAVDSSAVVSVGGLAPVSPITGATVPPSVRSISPLKFAAQLFCLHRRGTSFFRDKSCPIRARFDVLAIHPYTLAATPTEHAYRYDDVFVADMGKLQGLLSATDRLRTTFPRGGHEIWVTEWSWFTNPPNNCFGDRWPTAARYVAWGMYEMWRAGVKMIIWLQVADLPNVQACIEPDFLPGGALYASDGQAKPTLTAFAFPFVAGVQSGRRFAWGRVPVSRSVSVVVQRRAGRRWVSITRTRTASDGTFYVRFAARGNAIYRATVPNGPASLPYNSKPIPPRRTHRFVE